MASEVFNWSQGDQEQDAKKQKLHETQELANSQLQLLNLLPFRKMRFSTKIFSKQDDKKLVKSLKKKIGEDCVLIFGNWSAPTTKYHISFQNKGLLTMLKKNGFTIYLIDEFKMSSVCPDSQGAIKKFKKIPNPRPFKKKTMPTVTCNGLLKCNNLPSEKLWNRDLLAVLNFRKILYQLISTCSRPFYLSRTKSSPRTKSSSKRKRNAASSSRTKKTKYSA